MARKIPRPTRSLSAKQLKAKAALLQGKSKRQAVIAAGYSQHIADSGGETAKILATVGAGIVAAIESNPRLTDGKRAEKLADLMAAKKAVWNPQRKKFHLFEDGDLQLRTVQEVNRLKNQYPAPKEPTEDSRPITIVFGDKRFSEMMPPEKPST